MNNIHQNYRIWDKTRNVFRHFNSANDFGACVIFAENMEGNFVFQRSTGFKDIHGGTIYDGDIIRLHIN